MLSDDTRADLLIASLKDVHKAPSLSRVNGSGGTLLGTMREPGLAPLVLRMYWFTFFFLPLFPIRVYLVQELPEDRFRFFKALPLGALHRLYWGRLTRFYLGLLFGALLKAVLFLILIFAVIAAILFIKGA
jgi:hypothetical protein